MKCFAGIFFCLLFIANVQAQQSYVELDWANIRAGVSNKGVLFMNGSTAAFEVPKGSGVQAILSSALWIGAKDGNGKIYVAASSYDTSASDFYPGPIDKTTGQADDSSYWNYVWTADSAMIDWHRTAYNDANYQANWNIANWPGNSPRPGDFNTILAPFVDLNQNNVYEPGLGESPYIDGKQAAYFILNDNFGSHKLSGSDPMGIEVYATVYVDNESLSRNTVYVKYRIVNRSNRTYDSLMVGMMTDFLLGNAWDNYMSTDSARNMVYAYNGAAYDSNGYLDNPPAMGMQFLNQKLGSSMVVGWDQDNYGWPNNENEFFGYLKSQWKDGSKLQDPVSSQEKYHYQGNPCDGNGWTEYGSLQSPGRRRMLAGTEPISLAPGSAMALDLCYVFSDRGSDNLNNVCTMLENADSSRMYWDNVLSSIQKPTFLPAGLYPNPSADRIFSRHVDKGTFTVYGLDGRVSLAGNFHGSIDLKELENGLYIIQLEDIHGNHYRERLLIHK